MVQHRVEVRAVGAAPPFTAAAGVVHAKDGRAASRETLCGAPCSGGWCSSCLACVCVCVGGCGCHKQLVWPR